jgi:D-alanyl-D-alanine carboxypeptidase
VFRRAARGAALCFLMVSAFAGDSTRFGHFPYPEAPASTLAKAGPYRQTGRVVEMRAPAAEAFAAMAEAAQRDGVTLVPISGFRPVAYQKVLFDRARKRYGSARAAARWVAPPGHSEHATGWTLDMGDGDDPPTDIEQSFETTKAFLWLSAHAKEFHFELSFPKDNPQGVSYEPWHWRYVGDPSADKLFHSR